MGFVFGFNKIAKELNEHQHAGAISLLIHPGASAVYSHMKAPEHKRKEVESNYAKHRWESLKGYAKGMGLGIAAGAGLGIGGGKLYAKMRGIPNARARIILSKDMAKVLKTKHIPLGLPPAILGGFIGSNVGSYYGAKRGHEVVTGKKEK